MSPPPSLLGSPQRNIIRLIDGLGFEIVDVTPATARRVARAYARRGKGIHAAALNFGDRFAHDVGKERACPLVFVSDDFTQTDIEPPISRT